jgi:RNA polymerase sigma-70 factor (ECF subfamily)
MPLDSSPNPEALLQHADFLRGLARGLVAGADADDVEQETWLRALEKGPSHDANPRGWLATVARNSARLWWRGESRRARREGVVAKSEGVPSAAEVASRVEIQSLLADAVKSLEEPYRTTVVLAFYDGLKPTQIAQQQGIPVDTVRTRIRRALERLRARLDQCPGGRSAWVAALTPLLWPKGAAAAVTGALVMSTRLKIALVVLMLLPTAWLGRELWRGFVDRTPVRADQSARAVEASAVSEGTDQRGEQPPSEKPAAPVGFAGRVVAAGRPVEGAWVRVRGNGPDPVVVNMTPADGTFRTRHNSQIVVHAWHPDYGPRRMLIDQANPEQVVDIELERGRTVTIRVSDSKTGADVEGARVFVLSAGRVGVLHGLNGATDGVDEQTTKRMLAAVNFDDIMAMGRIDPIFHIPAIASDETGRVVLTGMPEGTFEAIVLHPDFVPFRARRAPVRDELVNIRMKEGATVVVRAPMIRGRPGNGLACEVLRGGLMPLPVGFGRLDEDGNARFEHLPSGEFAVVISSNGTANILQSAGAPPPPGEPSEPEPAEEEEPMRAVTKVVSLSEGAVVTVDFADYAGTRLEGRVLRQGAGVDDCVIWLHRGDRKVGEVRTDDQGRYGFDQLQPGVYHLRADLEQAVLMQEDVEIKAGESKVERDLVVAGGNLSGVVLGLDGEPLEDCEVVLTRAFDGPDRELEEGGESAIYYALRGRAKTDGAGNYRIVGIRAGDYSLLFGASGRLARRRVRFAADEQHRIDLDFRSEETRKLTVRFEGPDGKSVPAALLLRGAFGEYAEPYALTVELKDRLSYGFNLPRGKYRLSAVARGLAAVHGESIDLSADREIVLKFEAGVQVELTVRRDGRPASGAKVTLVQDNGVQLGAAENLLAFVQAPRYWLSPEDGVVVAPAVPSGSYRIRVGERYFGRIQVGAEPLRRSIELGGAK